MSIISQMMIYAILIFLSCFRLNAGEENETSFHIIEKFSTINSYDQKEIKLLFRDLFFNQGFSYSLFGNKPLSFSDSSLLEHKSNQLVNLLLIDGYCQKIMKPYCEPSSIIGKRWMIWNKYKNMFNFKNYILFIKPINTKRKIVIINKKHFKFIFNKNIDLFKKILKHSITCENLLRKFELEDNSILKILNNNEGLLGILLGFGAYNAMLFQKREEFINNSNKYLIDSEIIKEKIEKFNTLLQSLREHDSYIISSINRVCFAADPKHDETIELRNNYDALNRKINEIYSRDDWFEQILIQLTSD
jgi:hypothetical protein